MSQEEIIIKNEKGRGTIIKSVYFCYMISLLIGGIPLFVGLFINLFMREGANKIELSHFKYQVSLFIKGLIWGAIGLITLPIFIGAIILIVLFVWFIVRCLKGLDLASRGLPINEYYR